jgi:hypothetical protein
MATKIGSTSEDQKELFLWRWKDVHRDELNERYKEFKRFDMNGDGELEENNAMRLLESRGETKTAAELRAMLAEMDKNNNHKLSFLEWCCALYNKSFDETNNFVNEDELAKAMDEIRIASERAAQVEAAIRKAKEDEEAAAARRAEELERESKLVDIESSNFCIFSNMLCRLECLVCLHSLRDKLKTRVMLH